MANAKTRRLRENVGRIDHVVMIYRTQESLEAARKQFSMLLDIDDWDDLGEVYESVHVVVSWGSGLELIRPTKPGSGSNFDQHLATHGEGFYSLVFGVADMDQAMAHVAKQGATAHPLPRPPESIFDTFDVAREAIIGEVGAIHLTLGEFKPVRRSD